MYLRVTISVPPEGDDRLTLNKWMFDFERMPFWQYLLQDLAENLPAAPKDSTKELYDTVVQALGSEPKGTLKRLLVYLVNRTVS